MFRIFHLGPTFAAVALPKFICSAVAPACGAFQAVVADGKNALQLGRNEIHSKNTNDVIAYWLVTDDPKKRSAKERKVDPGTWGPCLINALHHITHPSFDIYRVPIF
jgi:hypothetical protein